MSLRTLSSGPTDLPMTFVEYFAGIGLFRMGFEAAGWQVVFANDWSPEREQMYKGFFDESYKAHDIFSWQPKKFRKRHWRHVPSPVSICRWPARAKA